MIENNILLESGTGEVELLEFVINNNNYAINVIKVREVLDVDKITRIPQTQPAISGLMLCRDEIITVVDLKYVLEKQKSTGTNFKVILCEFNKIKVAFIIDAIIAVHRIKWEQILKPEGIVEDSLVIGNIIMNEKVMFLLDFEKIVTDINPSTGISEDQIVDIDYKVRPDVKIILADDSTLIRKLLKDTLLKAGFKQLTFFQDGRQVLDYLLGLVEKKGESFKEEAEVLITDVEMPQLDGHTLTRKIKEHPILKKLPVIIFSSLITDTLRHKGEIVGADEQLSKPEVSELVNIIDKYVSQNRND